MNAKVGRAFFGSGVCLGELIPKIPKARKLSVMSLLPTDDRAENNAYCQWLPITVVTIPCMDMVSWERVVITAIVVPVLT